MTHFDEREADTTMRPRRLSRRGLLARGLAAAVLAAGPRFLVRPAWARARETRTLVCLFQRGAVDGLQMVVPHGEPLYAQLRGPIAIRPPGSQAGALDLDGFFGLPPSMGALLPAWDAGELAVVHACGSPDPTRSHFDAQAYMETATPGDKTTEDGWVNRHLQTLAGPAGLRALALAAAVPRSLSGPAAVYAATSLLDLELGRGRQAEIARAAIDDLYAEREDLLGRTVHQTLAHHDLFAGLEGLAPANDAAYPATPLGDHLREVARAIRSDLGVEVAFVETGGWDTHSNQGGAEGPLAQRLGDLADALAAFRVDLGAAMEDVCLVTLSEFGRTARVNGSGGTDHGHGTAMLLLGGPVRGGRVYGRWPGLDASRLHEGRDLAVTTDFRSLLAELVEHHLGNPALDAVFPAFDDPASERLGLLRL